MHYWRGQSAKYEGKKVAKKKEKIIGYVDLALKIIININFKSLYLIRYCILLFQSIPKNMVEKWGIKLQIFPKIQPDKEIKKHINVFLSNTEILNHISIDLGIKVTQ